MTTVDGLDDDLIAERTCATCGHTESDHEDRDVHGDADKRTFCLTCEAWHSFIPMID